MKMIKLFLLSLILGLGMSKASVVLADTGSGINKRTHIANSSKNKLTMYRLGAGLVLPKSSGTVSARSQGRHCQLHIGNKEGKNTGIAQQDVNIFIMGPVINYCN